MVIKCQFKDGADLIKFKVQSAEFLDLWVQRFYGYSKSCFAQLNVFYKKYYMKLYILYSKVEL